MSGVSFSSLVLYTTDLPAAALFYRTVGVPLEDEDHDEGPAHVAAEVGDIHFAIYAARSGRGTRALEWPGAGSDFPGFYVESLDDVMLALANLGAPLIEGHERRPWGCRIVVADPDGRAIEINQRGHC